MLTVALQKITSGVVTALWAGGGMILMTLVDYWFLEKAISKTQIVALLLLIGGIVVPEANSHFALGVQASDYGSGIRRLRYDGYQLIGHSSA